MSLDITKNYEWIAKQNIKMADAQSFKSGTWATVNADGELTEVSGGYGAFPLYQVFVDSTREDVIESNAIPVFPGGWYEAQTTEYDSTASYSVGTELVVYYGNLSPLPTAAGHYNVVGTYIGTTVNSDGEDVMIFERRDYVRTVS